MCVSMDFSHRVLVLLAFLALLYLCLLVVLYVSFWAPSAEVHALMEAAWCASKWCLGTVLLVLCFFDSEQCGPSRCFM